MTQATGVAPADHPATAAQVTAQTVALDTVNTPVGRLTVAVTEAGLVRVGWGNLGAGLAAGLKLPVRPDPARTDPVVTQLTRYFAGELRAFDLPLDWQLTTPTQRRVLTTLWHRVDYGSTVRYGELAELSGLHGAADVIPARVVGGVMGANPLPIVVPCHRVVASDGLGGYSGGIGHGLELKRWLLMFEGAMPPTLDFDPSRASQNES